METSEFLLSLTPKQMEVYEYMQLGYMNKQMAGFMSINIRTLELHVEQVRYKAKKNGLVFGKRLIEKEFKESDKIRIMSKYSKE